MELGRGGPQPSRLREWEQVRARIPCEFISIPLLQEPLSEVPQKVEWNVLVGTVEAASHSTYGTQRTVEEQLGTHNPHTVWIKQ